MREIKAIIQPHMLSKVMDALRALPHFPGVTVSDCQGQGRGHGAGGHFVPTEESIFFSKRVKLEVFCDDAICDELVRLIQRTAHTGSHGDGVVMVVDLARIVRIRTGEEQSEAT